MHCWASLSVWWAYLFREKITFENSMKLSGPAKRRSVHVERFWGLWGAEGRRRNYKVVLCKKAASGRVVGDGTTQQFFTPTSFPALTWCTSSHQVTMNPLTNFQLSDLVSTGISISTRVQIAYSRMMNQPTQQFYNSFRFSSELSSDILINRRLVVQKQKNISSPLNIKIIL